MTAALHLDAIRGLMRRNINEILRVPGAAIPGILAPAVFMVGLTAAFSELTSLRGFDTTSYISFLIPVSMLQGASFTGAATGVNMARDIELGWFDRLFVAPIPRPALLAGIVLSASFRALLPVTGCAGHRARARGALAGDPGTSHGRRLRRHLQRDRRVVDRRPGAEVPHTGRGAADAVDHVHRGAVHDLVRADGPPGTAWLQTVATYNPITQVIEGIRAVFLGDVTWTSTWHAMAVLAVVLGLTFAFALRQLARTGR